MKTTLTVIVLFFLDSISSQSGSKIQNFGNCMIPNNERGLCIYLNACSSLYSLIQKKPLRDDDIALLRSRHCGYNDGQVLVCCGQNQVTPQSSGGRVTTRLNGLLPTQGVCGNVISNRIYGGNKTAIDEYPWMALLQYTKPQNQKGFHCGGSLISKRYVITAAHCVTPQSLPVNWELTGVRLGEWDLSTERDCVIDISGEEDCANPYVDVDVERVIIHENYTPGSKNQYNDIALLRLAMEIQYTNFIQPICLPSSVQSRNANFNGVKMDIAGWGRTETSSKSEVKLKATVSGVGLAECNRVYNTQKVQLDETQICAGGVKGTDSCRGDSGGPLIGLDRNNKNEVSYFIVGIVSFGPTPCGLENWPGVYTRVGLFVDWIEKSLER